MSPLKARQLFKCGALLSLLVGAAYASGVHAMVAPFSATVALLAALPSAPFSRPVTLLVSHALCIGLGVGGTLLPFATLLTAMAAAWLAIVAMVGCRSLHAPAVAHTVILALGKQEAGWYAAVAFGSAVALAAVAWLDGRQAPALGASAPGVRARST